MNWTWLMLACLVFQTSEGNFKTVAVISDFEEGIDDWDNSMSNVKKKPKIEEVDEAKEGKKAAKITFSASSKKTDWTLLKCEFDEWPEDGTHLSFWIKSAADKASVQVKLSEMRGDHSEYEGFHKQIDVGTEWKHVRIPLSEFEFLWGMSKEPDKKLDKDKLSNISFAQPDVTQELVIFVDQIEIVKEEKK